MSLHRQRAKGIETSTFTLATLSDVDAKTFVAPAVTTQGILPLTINAQRQQTGGLRDAELAEVVEDWPQLPEILKRALIGMVRASTK